MEISDERWREFLPLVRAAMAGLLAEAEARRLLPCMLVCSDPSEDFGGDEVPVVLAVVSDPRDLVQVAAGWAGLAGSVALIHVVVVPGLAV